jgi:hypothetical protein
MNNEYINNIINELFLELSNIKTINEFGDFFNSNDLIIHKSFENILNERFLNRYHDRNNTNSIEISISNHCIGTPQYIIIPFRNIIKSNLHLFLHKIEEIKFYEQSMVKILTELLTVEKITGKDIYNTFNKLKKIYNPNYIITNSKFYYGYYGVYNQEMNKYNNLRQFNQLKLIRIIFINLGYNSNDKIDIIKRNKILIKNIIENNKLSFDNEYDFTKNVIKLLKGVFKFSKSQFKLLKIKDSNNKIVNRNKFIKYIMTDFYYILNYFEKTNYYLKNINTFENVNKLISNIKYFV